MAKHIKHHPKTATRLINFCLVIVLLVGLYFVGQYFFQQRQVAQEVRDTQVLTKKATSKSSPKKHVKKSSTKSQSQRGVPNPLKINWTKLIQTNKNIKAWINIPGTHINEAIFQGPNNQYYLEHDEYDRPSTLGQIFMDYRSEMDWSDQNTLVYGHDFANGTKFSDLNNYFSADFFKKHQTLYIYTPTQALVGQIFAVQSNSAFSKVNNIDLKSKHQLTKYVTYLGKQAAIKSTLDPTSITKLVTLWTCTERSTTNDTGEFVPANKARTFVSFSVKPLK